MINISRIPLPSLPHAFSHSHHLNDPEIDRLFSSIPISTAKGDSSRLADVPKHSVHPFTAIQGSIALVKAGTVFPSKRRNIDPHMHLRTINHRNTELFLFLTFCARDISQSINECCHTDEASDAPTCCHEGSLQALSLNTNPVECLKARRRGPL